MAEAVSCCGVDPVDAALKPLVDRGNRVVVLLRAPAELPTSSTDGPGSQPDGVVISRSLFPNFLFSITISLIVSFRFLLSANLACQATVRYGT